MDIADQHPQHSPQHESISSLKVLNKQFDQVLRLKPQQFTPSHEQTILEIIKHAQKHCMRQYLHLRYTQKLAYMLAKFKPSPQVANVVGQQIERVKQELLSATKNYDHIVEMEVRAIEKLKQLQIDL